MPNAKILVHPAADPLVVAAIAKLEGRIVDPATVIREKQLQVEQQNRFARGPRRPWPKQGAWVQLVQVDDAGHHAYRLHDVAGRPIAAGLFGSGHFSNGTNVDGQAAAVAFAKAHSWRVLPQSKEVAGD